VFKASTSLEEHESHFLNLKDSDFEEYERLNAKDNWLYTKAGRCPVLRIPSVREVLVTDEVSHLVFWPPPKQTPL
jgi:hypothetical protein